MRDNWHRRGRRPSGAQSSGAQSGGGRGTNGSRPDGLTTRSAALEEQAEPVDLVAVQADDELINALSSGMSVSAPGISGYDVDDRVAAVLAAWKAEVDAEPVPDLIDLDTAVAAITAARPRSARARHLAPVAAAAAFLVLAIGSLSVGSYSAEPDDMLWGVSKVLYSERAESVEAAARVEVRIATAKQALVEGQPAMAEQELQKAQADLVSVRPEEGLVQLADVQGFLLLKAQETPPGTPADLTAPLVAQPTRPVPSAVVVDPTTPLPGPTTGSPRPRPSVPAVPSVPDPRELATQVEKPVVPKPQVTSRPTILPELDDLVDTPVVPTPDPATRTPAGRPDPTSVPPESLGQIPGTSGGATGTGGTGTGGTAAGGGAPEPIPTS